MLRALCVLSCLVVYAQSYYSYYYYDEYDEVAFEESFLSYPNATRCQLRFKDLTQVAHVAGTSESYATALYIEGKMLSFGIPEVKIYSYSALLAYPVQRNVTILSQPPVHASLVEPFVDGNTQPVMMTYLAFTASGDVTATVVYVGFARTEDFAALAAAGINPSGHICIARYGKIHRGIKMMLGERAGCVGMLLYSDPLDEGSAAGGAVYPDGPLRPDGAVQRGSAKYGSICPGDPRRVELCTGTNGSYVGTLVPSIPAQPLSATDALPIFNILVGHGQEATAINESWVGGFPLTYYTGPSTTEVRLMSQISWEVKDVYDVIGTIPGLESNEVVMVGNHHDAWTFGGQDPSSGTAALLEVAFALGEMYLHEGLSPRRTIQLAFWDAEEFNLVGSTAYGESADFPTNMIAYINVDTASGGSTFYASGTPSLSNNIWEAADMVYQPHTNETTIYDSWDQVVGVLGSGSDFTVFLDHLGVPAIDLGFTGMSAVYHTRYDGYDYTTQFADPGDPPMQYAEAVARMAGLIAAKIANGRLLYFDHVTYATDLAAYVDTLNSTAESLDVAVDLSALYTAVASFAAAAEDAENKRTQVAGELLMNHYAAEHNMNHLNHHLMYTERHFLLPEGLPGRPWYKHVVQAPGIDNGYGSETFPGVTEALRTRNETMIALQVEMAARQVSAAAAFLMTPFTPLPEREASVVAEVFVVLCCIAALLAILFVVVVMVRNYRQRKRYNLLKQSSETPGSP